MAGITGQVSDQTARRFGARGNRLDRGRGCVLLASLEGESCCTAIVWNVTPDYLSMFGFQTGLCAMPAMTKDGESVRTRTKTTMRIANKRINGAIE